VHVQVAPRDALIFPSAYLHTSDPVFTGAKTFLRVNANITWEAG
jgi:hypothetical protein